MLDTDFEKYVKEIRGVLHVGANTGQELDWYVNKKVSRVIWFEPHNKSFAILQANIAEYKNHEAYKIGIHDTLKSATLHVASNSAQSSSILPFGTHRNHYPRIHYVGDQGITLMRMDHFLRNNHISIDDFNFLNVDVQGVELNVMKSFGEQLGKLDYIYSEVNKQNLYVGGNLLPEIDTYLDSFGFSRMALYMTPKHWGDALYVKKSLL